MAYYKKEEILQVYESWEKYALIIGYVVGNVLAYSMPEQEKYKTPSLVGFNAILLGIYGFNYYQQHGINLKLTQLHQEIAKEVKTKEKEVKEVGKENKQENKQEYIQKQQAIIETLQEIANNPLNLNSAVKVDELEERVPGIKTEYERVKEWLKLASKPAKETQIHDKISDELSKILTKTGLDENSKTSLLILASNLSKKQFLSLAERVPQLKNIEIDKYYPHLNNEQKLKLLEIILKHLGLNSYESKRKLVAIIQQKASEEKNFDLNVEEKENLLTFFIDGLQLTVEQKKDLEKLGVTFVNANNWKITDRQKENLLKLGLNKIQFNEEEWKVILKIYIIKFSEWLKD